VGNDTKGPSKLMGSGVALMHGGCIGAVLTTDIAPRQENPMPLFLIECNCVEAAEMNPDFAAGIKRVNDDVGREAPQRKYCCP
jgi:hypothetical protein